MAKVIVAFPKMEDAKNIRNLLVRNGYDVVGVCISGAQALQFTDTLSDGILVCGYRLSDMLFSEVRECMPPGFQMLLVASAHVLSNVSCPGVVSLTMPIKLYDLVNTLEMMSSNLTRVKKKRQQMPKKRSVEETRMINEAKRLLMERNNMTEEDAHRYIQKCSMDSGNSLVETAQMVFTLMKY